MSRLGEIVTGIRSKNAGPFWLTIDIFCGAPETYWRCCAFLKPSLISELYQVDKKAILCFFLEDLNVIKFSFPRPVTQGAIEDRDMHGAAWAVLLAEYQVTDSHVI